MNGGRKRRGLRVQQGRGDLSALRRRVQSEQGAPLTASELAALCQVEPRVVHDWAVAGKLPHFRTPGHHLRFQAKDVAQFLRTRELGDKPGAPLADTLVVCSAGRRGVLERRLAGERVAWFEDPLAALIAAGRDTVARLVVDAEVLLGTDAARYIDAVATRLPGTEIVWLGHVPEGKARFVTRGVKPSTRAAPAARRAAPLTRRG